MKNDLNEYKKNVNRHAITAIRSNRSGTNA